MLIQPRLDHHALTEKERQRIVELSETLSHRAIAAKLKVPKATVTLTLKRAREAA